jgi:hypothetical protein
MKLLFAFALSSVFYYPQGQEVPDAASLPKHVVFDLPDLRKLTITQIRERLGRPNANDKEPDPNNYMGPQWLKVYHREGIELRIDYIIKTGKIIRLYVSPVKGAIPENALTSLLATAHLDSKTHDFTIHPVFVHQDPKTHRYSTVVLTPY